MAAGRGRPPRLVQNAGMPSPIDALLPALRASHDQLAEIAGTLDGAGLAARSYCTDWSRAQVFSHLGSGAEISLGSLQAALSGDPEPDREQIWARWNALPADEMARGFVESDDRYLTAVEQLDEDSRESVRVPFFLGPTPLADVLTLRLNEHALHSWDIRVSLDPQETLLPQAVPLLLDLPPMLVGFASRPGDAELTGPVRLALATTDPDRRYLLTASADGAELQAADSADPTDTTGQLRLPAEAFVRLVSGRLDPDHTPADTEATGRPTLTQLRALFPGY